jgi:hypothetical protein
MKTWRAVAVCLLVFVLLFSNEGCGIFDKSLKSVDADGVEDVLTDMGYLVIVSDEDLERWETERAVAMDDDLEHLLFFSEYEDEKDAVYCFNNIMDDFNKVRDDENFDGKYTKTSGKNYQKCVIDGEIEGTYGDFPAAPYQVYLQVDNTLITLLSTGGSEKDVREMEKILTNLGY